MIRPLSQAEIALLRGLKKTLIVLLLLLRLQRPAAEGEIASLLDLSRRTARAYLADLSTLGLVVCLGQGWSLTPDGRQCLCAAPLKDSISSSTVSMHPDRSAEEVEITETDDGAPAPPDDEPASADLPADILQAFQAAGIGLNARTRRLARRPWISAELIRRQHQALAERGKAHQTGLLITLLEQGPLAAPESAAPNDRNRFIRGKYAHLIEH